MKTILLHIHDDTGMESRLQVALDLARAFDAHLTCVQATTQFVPMAYSGLGAEYVTTVNMDELRESDNRFRAQIEKSLKQEDIAWDWLASLGDAASLLIDNSALADLIVLSQSDDQARGLGQPLSIAGEVAIHAHCAVMMVPITQTAFDHEAPIIVGWNGSGEAAQAIRAALPLLRKSRQVHIITVDEQRADFPHIDASVYLARNGINSELHQLVDKNKNASHLIAQFAREHGAGAIVMGAYGHSRLRQTLFGGVTRDLLGEANIPLIMAH